jgi:hypothetical protein
MYLQITTVSDMCLADGLTLDPGIADNKHSHLSRQSSWLYFHQGQPYKHVRLFWPRLVLPIWFNQHQHLYTLLGPWLQTSNNVQRRWNVYYKPHWDFLYVLHNTTYHQYNHPSLNCNKFSFGIPTSWTPQLLLSTRRRMQK